VLDGQRPLLFPAGSHEARCGWRCRARRVRAAPRPGVTMQRGVVRIGASVK
jgi:hypothetical protein